MKESKNPDIKEICKKLTAISNKMAEEPEFLDIFQKDRSKALMQLGFDPVMFSNIEVLRFSDSCSCGCIITPKYGIGCSQATGKGKKVDC